MPLFAVIRSRGAAWDDTRPLEGQHAWAEHAAYMDALQREGFFLLAGPLQGTRDVLLIVRAESAEEVIRRLAEDPWTGRELDHRSTVMPWTLRIGALP